MSQKITVKLLDDLDPTQEADETITFAVDNATYTMDLTADHAEEFRAHMEKYTDIARRVTGATRHHATSRMGVAPRTTKPRRASTNGPDLDAFQRTSVRLWAAENGYVVAVRGRIAAPIAQAWQDAGSPSML